VIDSDGNETDSSRTSIISNVDMLGVKKRLNKHDDKKKITMNDI
jgi:hypothetical protein